jgi:hypothetical protein
MVRDPLTSRLVWERLYVGRKLRSNSPISIGIEPGVGFLVQRA